MSEGDAGRARQDRAGAPAFPRDVKDPLVIRADSRTSSRSCRSPCCRRRSSLRELTSLTDQTIVKGLENVPGRRAHRRQRAGDAADPDPDQARGADRARHRRRPGDRARSATRTRTCPRAASRAARATRSSASRARSRIRRNSAASSSRSRAASPVYLSQVADVIDGEKEPDSIARINGRPSITLDVQKAQDANIVETGRGVNEAIAALRKRLPPDVELTVVNSTADEVEKQRQPRQADDRRGRAAHRADRLPVPAQLAQHDHHRPDAADRGDRDVHRPLRVRLHAQLPDADGAVAVHRPPDRRRDRRAREHRAPPRHGQGSHDARRARAPTRSASR